MSDTHAFLYMPIPDARQIKKGKTYCEQCDKFIANIKITSGSHYKTKSHAKCIKDCVECEICDKQVHDHYLGPRQAIHCLECYRQMLNDLQSICNNCNTKCYNCRYNEIFQKTLCKGCYVKIEL